MTRPSCPLYEASSTINAAQEVPVTVDPNEPVGAWWTGERASLARWLDRRAPALTPLYRSAVAMVHDERFPGRVHFVAHAVREIRNRLPEALAGEIRHRAQYGYLTQSVYERWVEAGLPTDGSSRVEPRNEPPSTGPANIEVPDTLISTVGDLVAAHIAARETHRDKSQRMFEAIGEQSPPAYVIDNWLSSTEWSEKLAHVGAKPPSPEYQERLAYDFVKFEQSLMVIANRTYENMDVLDEILESANR